MIESNPHFTGTQVNYYFVCHRELWLFSHGLQMEQESDQVLQGKLLHEEAYSRDDKEIFIDGTIRLDRIESNGIIHEIKKSDKMESAHIWQLKYYLYYLKHKDIWPVSGKIDYPKLRQTVEVALNAEDEQQLHIILKKINELIQSPTPPTLPKKKICRNCSYFELCWS